MPVLRAINDRDDEWLLSVSIYALFDITTAAVVVCIIILRMYIFFLSFYPAKLPLFLFFILAQLSKQIDSFIRLHCNMDTSDRSMEYDKNFVKRPKEKKNHLAGRVNKFQEIVNQDRCTTIWLIKLSKTKKIENRRKHEIILIV